jgi:MFS family permease
MRLSRYSQQEVTNRLNISLTTISDTIYSPFMKMITRFSLYGFLKNFDFSEPFLILFYLSLGLDFFQIGILVGFLNVCINIMEIPSGAFADLYGRKTSMLVSLVSYLVAFAVFAFSKSYPPLFAAIIFYAVGDAFRTGTHKAMIFDWLKMNGRLGEKTKVYGFTRSWSNYGSAVSVVLATVIVIFTKDYRWVFILSMIPGALGVWNIACYPEELNKRISGTVSLSQIAAHTGASVKTAFADKNIRRLILQSLGFEGCFDVSKDYLQPVLQAQAVFFTAYFALGEKQSTAIVVGCIYFILHMISASASRSSHRFAARFKTEQGAVLSLIGIGFILALSSSVGIHSKLFALAITAYVLYYLLQNLWVPILVAQFDDFADSSQQATILSVASQTKTVGVAILAPAAGYLADRYGIQASMLLVAGILLALGLFSLAGRRNESRKTT